MGSLRGGGCVRGDRLAARRSRAAPLSWRRSSPPSSPPARPKHRTPQAAIEQSKSAGAADQTAVARAHRRRPPTAALSPLSHILNPTNQKTTTGATAQDGLPPKGQIATATWFPKLGATAATALPAGEVHTVVIAARNEGKEPYTLAAVAGGVHTADFQHRVQNFSRTVRALGVED